MCDGQLPRVGVEALDSGLAGRGCRVNRSLRWSPRSTSRVRSERTRDLEGGQGGWWGSDGPVGGLVAPSWLGLAGSGLLCVHKSSLSEMMEAEAKPP